MMAEHGDPCTGSDASYCMNGGKCFKIPSVSTPNCICNENYKGSRCEQFQLLSISNNKEETGMMAAVILLLILILLVLAGIIYYVYKMKRTAAQSQPKQADQYWKVQQRNPRDPPA
ncbi:uncharacterized protein nrg4 [Brachyhypopomus gauderio]|uniref:uncharacterized protein nrg4 n=1 Tax=Brachyhypopomus gauderio TaxID=698409 RepID=UPI004043002D